MKELTYILGAGASYESIPVVKSFNRRLLDFKNYILTNSANNTEGYRSKFNDTANFIQELYNDFLSHQSFDTYFKKLFHFNDIALINQGKRLLHLYFMWEHSQSSIKREDENANKTFYKQALFDRRYDALIAGLLEPISGKSQTLCKVNFISWNYDINLLHSIKNFFYPDLNYFDFFKKIKKDEFVWEIDENIKIINVNGYFYSSDFNYCANLTHAGIDSFIANKIYKGYCESHEIDADANQIRFAWELNEGDRNLLSDKLAKTILDSKSIVVIGYTFPLYNRLMDLEYFNSSNLSNKDVFIQNPDAKDIVDFLKFDYGIDEAVKNKLQNAAQLPKFYPKINCDSFFIPQNIFLKGHGVKKV